MASSRKGGPDLTDRLAAALGARPPGRLCVAYSGGLDSTVLLHLLAESRAVDGFSLSALHVHHGLSPQADAWAEHCRTVCAGLGVPLAVERVRVEPAGEGIEAAARAARYAVFARLEVEVLALAQHRDDQAETVLFQLLRGAGPRGLAAMPVTRQLAGDRVCLWRPLLDVPLADLEAWARERHLAWVEDESNQDGRYARNALRHGVLPRLEHAFPGAGASLARAAGRFAEAADLLDALADLDVAALGGDLGLDVAGLAALGEVRARNALRRYLEAAGGAIHAQLLKEALRQVVEARDDAQLAVDFGGVRLCRFKGRALVVPAHSALPLPRVWQGETRLDLGSAGALSFNPVPGGLRLVPGQVTVEFRHGGETLRPGPRRPRRALKALLREAGIPPWQRERLPVLRVDGRLAWVAGIGPDADCLVEADQPGWLIAWLI